MSASRRLANSEAGTMQEQHRACAIGDYLAESDGKNVMDTPFMQ